MSMEFPIHTPDTAPSPADETLKQVSENLGFIPNILGAFAEEPAMLEAYSALDDLFGQTALDDDQRLVVHMTASRLNGCGYCMAAHSTGAQAGGVDQGLVESLRTGAVLPDGRLEALRRFTEAVVQKHGNVSESDLDAFKNAGYGPRHAQAVVLGVAQKVLSNYVNHMVETPLDESFSANAWKAAE